MEIRGHAGVQRKSLSLDRKAIPLYLMVKKEEGCQCGSHNCVSLVGEYLRNHCLWALIFSLKLEIKFLFPDHSVPPAP